MIVSNPKSYFDFKGVSAKFFNFTLLFRIVFFNIKMGKLIGMILKVKATF